MGGANSFSDTVSADRRRGLVYGFTLLGLAATLPVRLSSLLGELGLALDAVHGDPWHFQGSNLPLRTALLAFAREGCLLVVAMTAWYATAPWGRGAFQPRRIELRRFVLFAGIPSVIATYAAHWWAQYCLVDRVGLELPSLLPVGFAFPAGVALGTGLVAAAVRFRNAERAASLAER